MPNVGSVDIVLIKSVIKRGTREHIQCDDALWLVRKICIKVGDIVLETVTSSKLLGVPIECLTWSVHIDVLSKKLSQKIGILRRLPNFMSNAALLKIYNTVVFPHLITVVLSGVQPKTKLLLTDFLDYRKGLAEYFKCQANPDFYYGYFTHS